MHLALADQDVAGAGAPRVRNVEQRDGGILFPESLHMLGDGVGLAQGFEHAGGVDLEVGDVLEVGTGEGAELVAEEVGTGGVPDLEVVGAGRFKGGGGHAAGVPRLRGRVLAGHRVGGSGKEAQRCGVAGWSLWGLLAGRLVGCGALPVGDVVGGGRSLVRL